MLERTQLRTLPVLNRTIDLAPAAQACCGICRTCVTTNVFTLAAAGVVTSLGFAARLTKRARRVLS